MSRKVTMGARIALGFGGAALALAAVGAIGLHGAGGLREHVEDLAGPKLAAVDAVWKHAEAQAAAGRAATALLVPAMPLDLRRTMRTAYADAIARMDEAEATMASLALSEEARVEWGAARERLMEWRHRVDAMIVACDERTRLLEAGRAPGDPALADVDARTWPLYLRARETYAAARTAADVVARRVREDAAASRAEAEEEASAAVRRAGLAVVAGAVALLALAAILARRIGRTVAALLGETGAIRAAVAEGRLAVRGDATRVDPEFRGIVQGMNETLDAFAAPLGEVAECLARVAKGDLPPPSAARYAGDFDRIRANLDTCVGTVGALAADTERVAAAAVAGDLGERADAARHAGAFRRVIEGVNGALDALVGHLDAMPAGAFIVDREFRVRWANRTATAIAGGALVGRRCHEAMRAEDCNTERCACMRAMRDGRPASSETRARPGDGSATVDVAYSGVPVLDRTGAIVGAFEVLSDTTAVTRARAAAEKVATYQAVEAGKLTGALNRLAAGDLDVAVSVAPADEDTQHASRTFATIADAVERSARAIAGVTQDVTGLATAAVEGRLSTRADATRREGEYRRIVEGLNRTLDAVVAPVNEATSVLERLAARDLRARMDGSYAGDHARLKDALDATGAALHDALAQVADAVDQVSSAAAQIAASSQAVASGASEQASALEETSTTIASLEDSARRGADGAAKADGLARAARASASEGTASLEGMQGAMQRIRRAAEGTAQIIKEVNEIAFQTNLLALNAAVEAARAGEAGRGFAVVAEEVRSLALRSKEAAQKTEALIRESVREAGEGDAVARDLAAKLGDISGAVGDVTDLVGAMASGSQEQAAGVAQVTRAVSEMDRVTQQNAASAEESSSAASELSAQAEELAAMLATFRIEREGRVRGAPGRLGGAGGPAGSGPGTRRAAARAS